MRISRRTLFGSLGACAVCPGLVLADAPLELAVIVHPKSSVSALDEYELEAIFTTTRLHWSGSERITAFNLPPYSPARTAFDRAVLRLSPDEVSRLWIDRRVRGGAPPPRQVPEPQLVVRVVATLASAIGYVPVGSVDDTVKVVARVKNGAVTKP